MSLFPPPTVRRNISPTSQETVSIFFSLIKKEACFEECFQILDICLTYEDIVNIWNYHQLHSIKFHKYYYKLSGDLPNEDEYRYLYDHYPLIRNLMEAHTIANSHHAILIYIGGSTQALVMVKIHGYLRPFVKIYLDRNVFDRTTWSQFSSIETGRMYISCYV